MRFFKRFRQKYLPQTLVRVKLYPLSYYVDMLAAGSPFSFSRFGDGEWNAILDKPGENCDGHAFFPALGADLRDAMIYRQPYIYGMQIRAIKCMGREMKKFLSKNSIRIDWQDADVFHYCNNKATLYPLVNQLRKMKVVVIGPAHLRAVKERLFPYVHFIEIPAKNCYLAASDIHKEILDVYEKTGPAVFAFSASMTTNVLIQKLYPVMGKTSWMIDFGSLWDVYVGVHSRDGYAKEDWTERMNKNCGVSL